MTEILASQLLSPFMKGSAEFSWRLNGHKTNERQHCVALLISSVVRRLKRKRISRMSISIAGMSGATMPSAVSGASVHSSPQQKMSSLFSQIDSAGSGCITQSQFNQAFQSSNTPAVFKAAGASAVWSAIDTSGAGQVSRQDFINGMKDQMVQLRQDSSSTDAAQTSSASTQTINLMA